MNRAKKAALLSALVFPGAGHLFLKCWVRGILLASVSLAALGYVAHLAVKKAMDIVDMIESGAVALNEKAITALLADASSLSGLGIPGFLLVGMLALWLAGIADAWRVGAREDGENPLPE